MKLKLQDNVIFWILILILAVAYIGGVFVPIVDNDSAHHASIALQMQQSGDYARLIDHGKDYIDKPHFQFWLVAASFEIFGVGGIVYKLSSIIFTILALLSTYQLAKHLTNKDVARLSVLVLMAMAAFTLANVDVRMDAILTAAVIIATAQGVLFIDKQRLWNGVLCAMALSIAFSTKGWYGAVTPFFSLLFYLIGTRRLGWIVGWRFPLLLAMFAMFIMPVVYSYYVQAGSAGVEFILWGQIFGRMGGDMGTVGGSDPFFYIHTLLWALLPFSMLFYALFFRSLGCRKTVDKVWWLTVPSIVLTTLSISFSLFKLPHYINVIFPLVAIFVANELCGLKQDGKLIRGLSVTQKVVNVVMICLAAVICYWAFAFENILFGTIFALTSLVSLWITWQAKVTARDIVRSAVVTSAVVWFGLNYNFYPQVMEYQAGNQMAEYIHQNNIPIDRIEMARVADYPFSFDIYTAKVYDEKDSVQLSAALKPLYVFADHDSYVQIQQSDLPYTVMQSFADYRVTRLNAEFLNPATRAEVMDTVYLLRLE